MKWTLRVNRKCVGPEFNTLREAVKWFVDNLFYHPHTVSIYHGRNWYAAYLPEPQKKGECRWNRKK